MRWIKAIAGRVAALVLLVALLAPVAAAAAWVAATLAEGEAERRDKLEQFDRLRAIASHGAGTAEASAAPATARWLLGAGTPAMLTSALQAKLRESAAEMGVDVLQASELPPEARDGLTRLGVRLEMVGRLQGIHALIGQIDRAEPWLFAGRLQLGSGFAAGGNPQAEPPLTASLDVWGFAETAAEPAKP